MASDFVILNPCSKRWTDLEGNGRSRFCASCQTLVHSIAEFSTKEWAHLWRESNGHVCAVQTLPLERPRSRREILVGALLRFAAPLMAQDGQVWFRVTDASGAVIPGAEVSLLDSAEKPIQTQSTNQSGEVQFSGLAIGNHGFLAKREGFSRLRFVAIAHTTPPERVDVVLSVAVMGGVVIVKKRRWWWPF